MLLGGDEIGRTQGGNNNAYCQDNELSWYDWDAADRRTARVHPPPDRAPEAASGLPPPPLVPGARDPRRQGHRLVPPDGEQMTDEDWAPGYAKSLAVFLNGQAIASPGPRGERIVDNSFYLAVNAHHEALEFRLPGAPFGERWQIELETAKPLPEPGAILEAGANALLEARSLTLFSRPGPIRA